MISRSPEAGRDLVRWRITLTFNDAGLGPGLLMWFIRAVIRVVDESPVPVRVRVERMD